MEEQRAKNPPQPKKTLSKVKTGKTLSLSRPKKPADVKKAAEGIVLTNLLLEEVKDISFSNVEHLAYEFAVRWWYALPSPWPPVNYDYSQKLKENNIRLVESSRFKSEPEEVDNLKKVFEIECY